MFPSARKLMKVPHSFPMRRGGVLEQVQIAYETWGEPNAAKDNTILIFTGLSPSAHAASSECDPSPGWWQRMIGPGLALDTAYEAKYGPSSRSQFAGHSYDAFLVLERVIPVALKTAKPGTPEFREAIRKALLTERDIAASQGVYNFTEKDRYGLDDRSRILLTVKDGKYVLAK